MDVVLSGCDELPSREGYARVEAFELRPGGAVSNVALQLAALAGAAAHALAPAALATDLLLPGGGDVGSAPSWVAVNAAPAAVSRLSPAAVSVLPRPLRPLFGVHACTTVGRDGLGALLVDAWRAAGVGTDHFVKVKRLEYNREATRTRGHLRCVLASSVYAFTRLLQARLNLLARVAIYA
jgi:hypothetical protein